MDKVSTDISKHNIHVMNDYIEWIKSYNLEKEKLTGQKPLVFTQTYGCQQNVADTERLNGLFMQMGFSFSNAPEQAEVALYNTCAIREGAEDRVFGNVGALKQAKQQNPEMIVAVCGCMTQQEHIAKTFRQSFPFVDLVFGAGMMHLLPQLLYQILTTDKRLFHTSDPTFAIVEQLPVQREGEYKAWLPIMTGCDNFCTYCVVPLVRGRERSRKPEDILKEAEELISQGYKEITLLGQNVNSYGKTLGNPMSFSELLQKISEIPGDYQLRFMTSHPKDCTTELIDTIGTNPKLVKHLHLPVQSGANNVLQAMNRRYTREHYLKLAKYAKENYPEIALTSDIIVGFPGETYDDFKKTLQLIQELKFHSLYTFLFSSREGTVAATMEDPVPLEEKKKWFQQLLDTQDPITKAHHEDMVGNTYKVLLEGESRNRLGYLTGRSASGTIVDCKGSQSLIGTFVNVYITAAHHWAVVGDILA